MRVTGGHALGEEAVAVVQQAVSLAARRRHAQVTPLHIARAMLSAPATAGILRAACVRSHSRPLQPNALDLALGRLAVTRHRGDPAPSNAFVATLKRAQAHPYRRTGGGGGKIEVEVEKLAVSVLDDPSVHRVVVRAAAFSSSQVRASVDASSEQSSRAGWNVAASSPNPFPDMIRAGGGQPSLPYGSGFQASKAKSGAGRPAIFGGTELDETANIPPWLRRYKDKTRTRLTYSGTNLQADAACRRPKFTELTATNLKILCDALELRVPRHRNIVPGISCTVLRCRSGVTRRRAGANPSGSSSSTCLLFLGRDGAGKMAVARDLARLVFGSYAEVTTLQVQGSPDIPARSGKHVPKRTRSPENDDDDLRSRLFEAIVKNPHRVILIDGVDRLDRDSETRIKNAIVDGGMAMGCKGGVVSLDDAIVVLSASDFLDSRYMASSSSQGPRVKRRFNGQNREEGDAAGRSLRCHGWDLNVCAVDEKEEEEDSLADDEGILNGVDGVFIFN